jgi:HEAT repeat protein
MNTATLLPVVLALFAAPDDLAARLKSKDAGERLAALRELVASEVPKRDTLLLAALRDDDWQLVEEAARALGAAHVKAAFDELAELALEGPVQRVRHAAADAMAAIDPHKAFAELAKKSGKEPLRAFQAMESLASTLDGKVSLASLEKGARAKELDVRMAAARASVALAGEERARVLGELLLSEDLAVRAAALEGAALAGDRATGGCIEGLLDRDALEPCLERRAFAVVDAAFRRQRPEPHELTRWVALHVGTSAPLEARMRWARLVGYLADRAERCIDPEDGAAALEVLVDAPDAGARAAAAWALGRIATKSALAPLQRLIVNDSVSRVRLIAFEAALRCVDLGAGGKREMALRVLADDRGAENRETAAVALGVSGNEGVVPALVRALQDRELAVRLAAAVSLGKTRDPAAVDALLGLAKHEDWRLRGAAIVGLTRVAQARAVPTVIDALADPDPLVRRTAHAWLMELAHAPHAPDPETWRTWWKENEERVRFVDPDEARRTKERLGYALDPTEALAGVDVVVLESRGDHIETVLAFLGIVHRRTQAGRVGEDGLSPRAVFVANCTGEIESEDVERLAWFVRTGGALFGSCWALQETIARACPGYVRRLETRDEVLDEVPAYACVTSPYLEGVFPADVTPIYALQGAYLIDVVDRERVEVLVDSPVAAQRWGGGDLAAWFRVGHGVVLDSVNHFDVQGFELAHGLKKPQERMAYAVDHMGLSLEELRKMRGEKLWSSASEVAAKVKDLSVLRLVSNFVRYRRIADQE